MRSLGVFIALLAVLTVPAHAGSALEQWILEDLQKARKADGAPELRHRKQLDRVAQKRAEAIAALPHNRRMSYEEPLESQIRRTGLKWIESAGAHTDMLRGFASPAASLMASWRNYRQAWKRVMDPDLDSVGLGSATGKDGWLIFVAVTATELTPIEDVQAFETRVTEAINVVRAEHGLPALVPNETLGEIARAHSEDMARRDFFDHKSPDGLKPADRVTLGGLDLRMVGENIHMSRGRRDPLKTAVEGWMASRGHRRQILTRDYEETGMGVYITDDATIYITQLFFTGRGR